MTRSNRWLADGPASDDLPHRGPARRRPRAADQEHVLDDAEGATRRQRLEGAKDDAGAGREPNQRDGSVAVHALQQDLGQLVAGLVGLRVVRRGRRRSGDGTLEMRTPQGLSIRYPAETTAAG